MPHPALQALPMLQKSMTAFCIASFHGHSGWDRWQQRAGDLQRGRRPELVVILPLKLVFVWCTAFQTFHLYQVKSSTKRSCSSSTRLVPGWGCCVSIPFLPVCLFAEFSLRLAFKSVLRQRLQRPFWHLHARRRPFHEAYVCNTQIWTYISRFMIMFYCIRRRKRRRVRRPPRWKARFALPCFWSLFCIWFREVGNIQIRSSET